MDGAGKKLFPRTAGTFNQDRAVALGDQTHDFEQTDHGGASPDDIFKSVSAAKLFLELFHLSQILERLHTSNDIAGAVSQQRRRDANGDKVPLLIDDMGRCVDDRLSACHRAAKSAVLFAYICPENIKAETSDGRVAADASDSLGCRVEGRDSPVLIDRENTLIYGIQDGCFSSCIH